MTVKQVDFCIVGGGIAGLSLGAELAVAGSSVLVLEREPQPAYHATGRSAALFAESYGNATIRSLTRASRAFYTRPPAGFTDVPLVHARGTLHIARAEQRERLDQSAQALHATGIRIEQMNGDAARRHVPVLSQAIVAAVYDPAALDIDVGAVVAGYRSLLRRAGGELQTGMEFSAAVAQGDAWRISAGESSVLARVLVNAAGAWADEVATRAGVSPFGLRPLRRSAAIVELTGAEDARGWPCVIDSDETFYFKADAGLLLVSPADETPSAACDAQAEDLDIALAVERIEQVTTLRIRRVRSQWAGLRTFAPDRIPVVGFDARCAGFFWLAAQGGYGLQTAPAIARVAAALARGRAPPADLAAFGVTVADIDPRREHAPQASERT
jgi:D-arginine dehydrogenase